MIDENKTFEKFGYYSTNLIQFSNRKIVVICNKCGQERIICKKGYTDLCRSCVQIGKHHTKDSKLKISKAMLGRKHSKESKEKMSIAKINEKNPNYNKHPSFKTIEKLSIAMSGKNHPNYGKFGNKHPAWKGGKRISNRNQRVKRREMFDPNPIELNKDFKDSHGHHINPKYIINIPAKLHKSISHRQTDGKGMYEINKLAFRYLYNNKENIILDEEAIYLINIECYNK